MLRCDDVRDDNTESPASSREISVRYLQIGRLGMNTLTVRRGGLSSASPGVRCCGSGTRNARQPPCSVASLENQNQGQSAAGSCLALPGAANSRFRSSLAGRLLGSPARWIQLWIGCSSGVAFSSRLITRVQLPDSMPGSEASSALSAITTRTRHKSFLCQSALTRPTGSSSSFNRSCSASDRRPSSSDRLGLATIVADN